MIRAVLERFSGRSRKDATRLGLGLVWPDHRSAVAQRRRDDRAGALSHGQKQWLEIGMLLMQDPQLLLVDESVAGMTPQEIERTAELLVSLAGEHSVIVVEHDMDFVRSIARRVTVLHEGAPPEAARRARAPLPEHLYDMFPVLKQMLRRRGGDLSGGQQQQLAIARALVLDPTLLILDEPTEGIQPNIVHEIGEVIQRLNREANLTVLLVEQKLPFARRVASHLRMLDKGRLVVSGRIADADR